MAGSLRRRERHVGERYDTSSNLKKAEQKMKKNNLQEQIDAHAHCFRIQKSVNEPVREFGTCIAHYSFHLVKR